jgi:hypothetical protein
MINMKVAVWDTYVEREDGKLMHFDIIATQETANPEIIYGFGKEYLRGKKMGHLEITSKECQFCHVETVKPDWEASIMDKGYYIYEMENCT